VSKAAGACHRSGGGRPENHRYYHSRGAPTQNGYWAIRRVGQGGTAPKPGCVADEGSPQRHPCNTQASPMHHPGLTWQPPTLAGPSPGSRELRAASLTRQNGIGNRRSRCAEFPSPPGGFMKWFYRVNGQVITCVESRGVLCIYWRPRRPPTFLPSSTKEFVRYTIFSPRNSSMTYNSFT
jgi:hypothetical protein